ncbi:MAG: phosphodiester glycosidase family protein [Pontiellaceae bacterium]|nr:phosphodiester glycosidase family protein [Pontiellaceae bacterium]
MKQNRFPYLWAIFSALILVATSAYVLLDAFLIPRALVEVAPIQTVSETTPIDTIVDRNADSYTESQTTIENSVKISTHEKYGATYYVADIQLSNPDYLKTAFAKNTFGRNIVQYTSTIAKNNNAVLAINGDFYGFRDRGLIIRNGVLYRDNPRSIRNGFFYRGRSRNNSSYNTTLVIDKNGDFTYVAEGETAGATLIEDGVTQSFSFGPVLVSNGEISNDTTSQSWVAAQANPRAAIGQVGPLHYIFVVVDGRTGSSEGMTLPQLAQVMADHGAINAYNLDGGGSATMYYNGKVINRPTDGRSFGERQVSDIVYIAGK